MLKQLITIIFITILGIKTVQAKMPDQINFGIISTESASALEKSFAPFLSDMSKSLGVTVKPFFASDYAGVIEAMRFNKVDLAWFGNKSCLLYTSDAADE